MIKKLLLYILLVLNLVYFIYLLKPFNIREELVPGYYILTKEDLLTLTHKKIPECSYLQDITFYYRNRKEANNKRVYKVKNKNGKAVSYLFLVYKDIECSTCKDVLYSILINDNAQITQIFPIIKINLEGKNIERDNFYSQFNSDGLRDKQINLEYVEAITGATPTGEKILEGIMESLTLLSGD